MLVSNYGGRDLFITDATNGGHGNALFTAIPEPGVGLVLMGMATLLLVHRRRSIGQVRRINQFGPICLVVGLMMAASTTSIDGSLATNHHQSGDAYQWQSVDCQRHQRRRINRDWLLQQRAIDKRSRFSLDSRVRHARSRCPANLF